MGSAGSIPARLPRTGVKGGRFDSVDWSLARQMARMARLLKLKRNLQRGQFNEHGEGPRKG
jgi:hypothetical protein